VTFLFNPEQPVEPGASAVNGYTWNKLKAYPTFAQRASQIRQMLDSADIIIAHNAKFDIGFLKMEFARCGINWTPKCVECTIEKAKKKLYATSYKLDNLTRILGLQNLRGRFHGSKEDTYMCKALYYALDDYPKRKDMPKQPISEPKDSFEEIIAKLKRQKYYLENRQPKYSNDTESLELVILWSIIIAIIMVILSLVS
jgi:DNA polymerase-3 subunit epsilon